MICNYQNIYGYCCNKYSYTYANIITFNNYVVANTGYDGSVYRTDKNTNETILLQPNSSLKIKTCDLNDEDPSLTAWECYLWYKNNNCGSIGDPPLEDYQLAQIDLVNSQYDNFLDNGLLISISNFATDISLLENGAYSNTSVTETTNFSIVLPAKQNDVINFSNILSLATLLNANDDYTSLPAIVDFFNNAHFFNYYNLTNILSNYFNKLKSYKILKDNLIKNILNSTTISDIQQQYFNPSYFSNLTYKNNTDLSSKNSINIKFSLLSCEEKEQLCDPPCDVDNCEACIDGSCESFCDENQYCCSGVCQNEQCSSCVTDEDCCECWYSFGEFPNFTFVSSGPCPNGQLVNGGCPETYVYNDDTGAFVDNGYCCNNECQMSPCP